MKLMKKLLVVLVAVLMVMSTTKTVKAETYTITIDNALDGEEYTAYKIFDVTYSGTNQNPGTVPDAPNPDNTNLHTAYAYTIAKSTATTSWWSVVTSNGTTASDGVITANGLIFTPTTAKDDNNNVIYSVQAVTEGTGKFDPATFAALLNTNKAGKTGTTPVEAANGKAEITVSEPGYYFVDTTLGSLCSLDTTEPNATIREKNTVPQIVKTELDNNSTATAAQITKTSVNTQIGDTVWFKLVVTDGKGTDNVITVFDKLDDGLTLTQNSFAITVDGTSITPVTTGDAPANGCKIEVGTAEDGSTNIKFIFGATLVNGLADNKEIVIIYAASVNEKAAPGVAEKNTAYLTYSGQTSTESAVTVLTYQFEVLKYDGNDANKAQLPGAVFELRDNDVVVPLIKVSDTVYRVAKTGETGVNSFTTVAGANIVIKGVDLDKGDTAPSLAHAYTLYEVDAPEGYNALKEAQTVTVNKNNNAVVEVPNYAGPELPSTGGIGTTIFHVAGALLVLGAGIVLISKKRANNN